jgi:hypothetical protein
MRPLCSLSLAAAVGLLAMPVFGQAKPRAWSPAPPSPAATGTAAAQPPPDGEAPPEGEPTPEPEPADASLGDHGESCRARADCQAGLRCLGSVCTDPQLGETCGATADCGGRLRCVNNVCGGPQPSQGGKEEAKEEAKEDDGGGLEEWSAYPMFQGTTGFVGLAAMGGVGIVVPIGGKSVSDPEGTFLFAVRGGVLFDRIELALEVSPVTYYPFLENGVESNFQANASFGYHVPLADKLSWPLRAGVGIVAVNTPHDDVYFEGRVDAVGLSISHGHLLFDTHFPSFRLVTEFDKFVVLDWLVGGGIAYVF